MRYALYARYSSDRQNEYSIEDQLRLCRERVAQLGGTVVAAFADAALSGASMVNRPGLQALLAAARAGAFDAVLAEALDRLSRGQSDTPRLLETLTGHLGIPIVTLAEGTVDELHVGFKGTMNALFLKDLAAKIRRGQRGAIERGQSAGGLGYGYRVVRALDAEGELLRGGRAVDEGQAAIVRRIFADYAAGVAPVAIAKALNAAGVPSPMGRAWVASCITGNAARGNGILHSEAYLGRLVYNRTTFRKDPETGKRISRANPRAAWIVKAAPHLRIVEDALWRAAHAVMDAHRRSSAGGHVVRRPKHLFAGLVVCGACGGQYARRDTDKLGCSNRKDRGTCANARTLRVSELERRILGGMRDKMVAPDMIAAAVRTYHAERQRLRRARAKTQAAADGRLKEVTARIGRIVTAIEEGTADAAMKARLMELGRERDRLAAELGAAGDDTLVEFHPGFVAGYQARLAVLAEALNKSEAIRQPAMAVIRGLVRGITLTPRADGPGLDIDLDAELEGLARLVRGEAPRADRVVLVVAEERARRNATGGIRLRV